MAFIFSLQSFLLRFIVLEFFAIFNFFSANGNRIANDFCYIETAKKKRDIFATSFACTWPGPKYPIPFLRWIRPQGDSESNK